MYCPQCGVAYRDGFTECSDCQTALLPGPPPGEAPSEFDPNLGLAVVLESNDPIQIAMVKGLLEDAEIPFFVLGQITTLVQDVDGFLRKWVRIQVPRDREAEVRELLEMVMRPDPNPPDAPEDTDAAKEPA